MGIWTKGYLGKSTYSVRKVSKIVQNPNLIVHSNKTITKVNYEVTLDSDHARTQVVYRNHLVEYFPQDNEIPKLFSNYGKTFVSDKTEQFFSEYANNRLSQWNPPIDSFVERKHLHNYSQIFRDTPRTSRKDTTFNWHNRDDNSHSTPEYLSSSPDSGIPQSSLQRALSFQSEATVISSQPTVPSSLPRTSNSNPNNLNSTSTGTTPRSRTTGTLTNISREWYEIPYLQSLN